MSGMPVGQSRIGKKRHPEGDEIGATLRDGGVARIFIVAAVENERPGKPLPQTQAVRTNKMTLYRHFPSR
jgi:hypothetical protein